MTALSAPVAWPGSAPTGHSWMYEVDTPEVGRLVTSEEGTSYGQKRLCPRRPLYCKLQMIPLSGEQESHASDAIVGDCINISDGGLYGTVPIGFGMAVGQPYIFRLRTRELGPEGRQTVLRQGIVVRTELLRAEGGDQVGIGVRFCGHRSGVLCTPGVA